jgi:hypothetical protein
MFGKKLGLHILQFPNGRWGYVGSIPTDLATAVPATTAAVLGCRAWRCPDTGAAMEWKDPTFDTEGDAIAFAQAKGHTPLVRNVPQRA